MSALLFRGHGLDYITVCCIVCILGFFKDNTFKKAAVMSSTSIFFPDLGVLIPNFPCGACVQSHPSSTPFIKYVYCFIIPILNRSSPPSQTSPLSTALPHSCNRRLPFHSITLHLKISCPSSPAMPVARGMSCPVPQVKIEMESDYDDTDMNPRGRHRDHRDHRDMSSETTL